MQAKRQSVITLYELVGKDSTLFFSPNTWRTRLSLLHKQLPFETVPLRFHQIEPTLGSMNVKYAKVPVISVSGISDVNSIKLNKNTFLLDDNQPGCKKVVVCDSWNIAEYLEDNYREGKSLFGGESGRGLSRFFSKYVNAQLFPAVRGALLYNIYNLLDEESKPFFRETREAMLNQNRSASDEQFITLEKCHEQRFETLQKLNQLLLPLQITLSKSAYLHGENPGYSDFVLFSFFRWIAATSPQEMDYLKSINSQELTNYLNKIEVDCFTGRTF